MLNMNLNERSRAEFSYEAPDANMVFLVGQLGERRMRARPMTRGKNGEWRAVLHLPPGAYRYKFVAVYRGMLNVQEDHPTFTARWNRWK